MSTFDSAKSDRAVPAFRQLRESLREQIVGEGLEPGAKLPTELELKIRYGYSRQTIRRALEGLVNEGLVYRVRGQGTFVADGREHAQYFRSFGSVDELMRLSVDSELEVREPIGVRVDLEAAGRLLLPADTVSRMSFRRLHNDVPFSITTVYLPPKLGATIAKEVNLTEIGTRHRVTVIALLDRLIGGGGISAAQQSIVGVALSADHAAELDVREGAPGLRIDRLYLDSAGTPVELAIGYYASERYSYRVELRRQARG